jgi:hypothetical protein
MAPYIETKKTGDKSASFTLIVDPSDGSNITQIIWTSNGETFSSGSPTASLTVAEFGAYNISVGYKNSAQNDKGAQTSITFTDPQLTPVDDEKTSTTTDAFYMRPFIIPPESNGEIKITASITDLSDVKNSYDESKVATIDNYITFGEVPIEGDASIELYMGEGSYGSDEYIVDDGANNMSDIPAFYDYGQVYIQYTIGETDDPDAAFDIDWDMAMSFAAEPSWYGVDLTYDSLVCKDIITGDASNVKYPSAAQYTTMIQQYTIGTWKGIPPFKLDWWTSGKEGETAIKRALLYPPEFRFTITNNISSKITLNNISIKMKFFYYEDGTLMNIRSSTDKTKESTKIYVLPKGSELVTQTLPIFGIVDGYEMDEIVKIWGFYDKWYADTAVYFPSCFQLMPVTGYDGTNHPCVLWKSDESLYSTQGGDQPTLDYTRMAYKGMSNSEYLKVITPQIIAADEYYRIIDVKCDGNVNDEAAIFTITIKPNDTVDDFITAEELGSSVASLRFYNQVLPFSPEVTTYRSSVHPVFYERMQNTYKNSVVLESIKSEPLHFVEFTINDSLDTYIPIYHGQTVEFSDYLTRCNDGIRSGDVFNFSMTNANKIGIKNPTQHKYKVKFHVDYEVYKDIYIMSEADQPWLISQTPDSTTN